MAFMCSQLELGFLLFMIRTATLDEMRFLSSTVPSLIAETGVKKHGPSVMYFSRL